MDKEISQKLTGIETLIADIPNNFKILENKIALAISHLDQQSANKQLTAEQIQNNLAQGILNLQNVTNSILTDYSVIKNDYLKIRQDYITIREIVLNYCNIKEDNLEEFEKIKAILIPKSEEKKE